MIRQILLLILTEKAIIRHDMPINLETIYFGKKSLRTVSELTPGTSVYLTTPKIPKNQTLPSQFVVKVINRETIRLTVQTSDILKVLQEFPLFNEVLPATRTEGAILLEGEIINRMNLESLPDCLQRTYRIHYRSTQ